MVYDINGNRIDSGSSGFSWENKKIVFDGDSLTANPVFDPTTGTYTNITMASKVCDELGAICVNNAVGGSRLFGLYEDIDDILLDVRGRLSKIPSDADALVFMGDVNSSVRIDTIGSITDNTINSWYGRYNIALEGIKKSFPTVPVFLVAEYAQGKRYTSFAVSEGYETLAKKWGCVLVDLPKICAFDLQYSSKKYGRTETDETHCNLLGLNIYTPHIINKIKATAPCEWIGSDSITIDSSVSVNVGGTADIESTISGDLSIAWTSSDYTVAGIVGGTVYGMNVGTATITATTRNGHTATCAVTVTAS